MTPHVKGCRYEGSDQPCERTDCKALLLVRNLRREENWQKAGCQAGPIDERYDEPNGGPADGS